MRVYSESLTEIAAGRPSGGPSVREFCEVTKQDLVLAARTLSTLQAIYGTPRFGTKWTFPKGSKDDRPLIIRRVWFYALSTLEDDGRPLYPIRKLARISDRDESVVRLDCALVQGWTLEEGSMLPGMIEHAVELVSGAYAAAATSDQFFQVTGEALRKDRETAREARMARAPAAPLPLPIDNRTPFQIELDNLREIGKQRLKADHEAYLVNHRKEQEAQQARIAAAVAARKAREAEAKAARKRKVAA